MAAATALAAGQFGPMPSQVVLVCSLFVYIAGRMLGYIVPDQIIPQTTITKQDVHDILATVNDAQSQNYTKLTADLLPLLNDIKAVLAQATPTAPTA